MSKLERQPLVGKYKPYPEYKDSGVEWLGKIPSHWAIKKIAWYFKAQKGRNAQMLTKEFCGENPGDFPVYSGQTENDGVMGCINSYEFDSAQDGCLFATTVGAKAMTLSFLKGKFSLSQNCMVITPTSDVIDTRFYFYHCQPLFSYERGLIPEHMQASFRMEDLYQYQIAMPNLQEQQAIAAFLDYETTRIDRLIAQQQRLIELLKEKRQAVISHAVTKGLNPNSPMKDSGIEWLGQVPEHWGVSALGYYSMLNTGATPDRSKNQYWGGTIPWIKTGEVRYDTIYETEETITQAALSETSVRLSKPGTLLMAMYGQGITRGRVAILGVSATYNQACVAITPNSKVTTDFLKFFFMAGYDALRDGGNETSQMNLNADIVSKFKVLVPSYEEQIDIVSFLRIKLAHYEQLINKSEHAIALMQERRTALISAAVTGKIDLRGWEPPAEEAAA